MSIQEQKDPFIFPLGEDVDMVFEHIPAGSYRIGDRNGNWEDQPVHEVWIDEFWVSRTKVSIGESILISKLFKSQFPCVRLGTQWTADSWEIENEYFQRQIELSWYEARGLGALLTGLIELDGKLSKKVVVDLPTENQWDRANEFFKWDESGYTQEEWCQDIFRGDANRLIVPGVISNPAWTGDRFPLSYAVESGWKSKVSHFFESNRENYFEYEDIAASTRMGFRSGQTRENHYIPLSATFRLAASNPS